MQNEALARAIVSTIESEILNLEHQRLVCEMKIEDAAVLTGNEGADDTLKQQAQIAANTIAMIDRQLEVRRSRLDQHKGQLKDEA
jgi:hypothetical protein